MNNALRWANRTEFKRLLELQLVQHACEPLADRLVHAGVPCAPIHDLPAALADPHTAHRGMVVIGEGVSARGVADQGG